MRVVMFGYQTWGHRTLQALLDSEHDVVLVVTHPGASTPTRRSGATPSRTSPKRGTSRY